ncbi:YesL family protein [Aquibacillus salsiterrae]|uniref:DUF624 domain-containing protein n=1 Tax=Aquibacillus salsiterrae TaxID=2950439 RepID=A0A9X3WEP6_9BACI|nr:DUF624 domain-containing protein [Aquibacillus salsiterrae]MDC3416059.1 DUF624 domain-containing protein [Aquibacillus salsiterrae]
MNIFSVDSRFYQFLNIITNFFLLNLLWIIFCIPVFTIFPSTTGMFGVVRQWKLNNETSVFRLFFTYFKQNFKISIQLSVIWLIILLILVVDFYFVTNIDTNIKYFLFPFFFALGFIYLFTSVFLFPVLVNFELEWKAIIKNSFLLGISHLHIVFFALLLIIVTYLGFVVFPILFLIMFSTCSYFVYLLCNSVFKKMKHPIKIENR